MNSEPRDKFKLVRVDAEMYRRACWHASAQGASLSDYIRTMLAVPVSTRAHGEIPVGDDALKVVIYDREVIFKTLWQLRMWSSNFDQAIVALEGIEPKRFLSKPDAQALFPRAHSALGTVFAITDAYSDSVEDLFFQSGGGEDKRIAVAKKFSHAQKTRVLSFRLTRAEFGRVASNARAIGCNMSTYVRAVVSLPPGQLDGEGGWPGSACASRFNFDNQSVYKLCANLRSWGYKLNAAAHAFNYMNRKSYLAEDDAREIFAKAVGHLEAVCSTRREFQSIMDGLRDAYQVQTDSRLSCEAAVAFYDHYGRKG